MKNLIIFIVLSFIFCIGTFAQENSPCPAISVSGPSDIGQPLVFTAEVKGVSLDKIGYVWTVSNGTITDGQGTTELKVLQKGNGEATTATIEITGLPENCPKNSTAIATMTDGCGLIQAKKIAEFSSFSPQIFTANLDNFVIELNNDPTAKAYILERFKKNKPRSQIEETLNNLNFQVRIRKFPIDRISFFISENDENLTEFWIIPIGADSPSFGDSIKINLQNYKKDLAKIFVTKRKKSQQKFKLKVRANTMRRRAVF